MLNLFWSNFAQESFQTFSLSACAKAFKCRKSVANFVGQQPDTKTSSWKNIRSGLETSIKSREPADKECLDVLCDLQTAWLVTCVSPIYWKREESFFQILSISIFHDLEINVIWSPGEFARLESLFLVITGEIGTQQFEPRHVSPLLAIHNTLFLSLSRKHTKTIITPCRCMNYNQLQGIWGFATSLDPRLRNMQLPWILGDLSQQTQALQGPPWDTAASDFTKFCSKWFRRLFRSQCHLKRWKLGTFSVWSWEQNSKVLAKPTMFFFPNFCLTFGSVKAYVYILMFCTLYCIIIIYIYISYFWSEHQKLLVPIYESIWQS